MRIGTKILALAAALTLGAGCDGGRSSAGPSTSDPAHAAPTGAAANASAGDAGSTTDNTFAKSTQPLLQWKRAAAFESDLAAALALPKDSLCKEFGREPCIRGVHLSPLGGHDPFSSGLLEPSAEPLATTPTVYERIVLSACAQRAQRDLSGTETAEVFKDLTGADAGTTPSADAARAVVIGLYRRFLARDPSAEEQTLVTSLTTDAAGAPVSALAFAQSACFAVGTSTEFLFF